MSRWSAFHAPVHSLAAALCNGQTILSWLTINDEPVSKTDDEFNQMFLVGSKVCAIYKEKTGTEPSECSTFITEAPEKDWKPYAAFEKELKTSTPA